MKRRRALTVALLGGPTGWGAFRRTQLLTTEDLAVRFVQHVTAGAVAQALDLCDPAVTYGDLAFGVQAKGVEQLAPLLRSLDGLAHRSVTLEDRFGSGGRACVAWQIQGVRRGTILGIPPDGNALEIRGVTVFRASGDRLVQITDHVDRYHVERQLGRLG